MKAYLAPLVFKYKKQQPRYHYHFFILNFKVKCVCYLCEIYAGWENSPDLPQGLVMSCSTASHRGRQVVCGIRHLHLFQTSALIMDWRYCTVQSFTHGHD